MWRGDFAIGAAGAVAFKDSRRVRATGLVWGPGQLGRLQHETIEMLVHMVLYCNRKNEGEEKGWRGTSGGIADL